MPEIDLDAVRITNPADVRPAAERLRNLVHDLTGFRTAICHNIASKQSMVDADGKILATDVFGWTLDENDRWWRTPRLALDSPLPTACRYESEPFWCNASGIRGSMPNPMLEAIDLTHFERRGLTPAAIVVPVHLPFGQIGAASYLPVDRANVDLSAEFKEFGDTLGLLTRTFIAGYVRVMCNRERLPVGAILSKREVECLRWAAVGKTDFEISLIIVRSRATVRFHIHNASTKLDAVNRSQTLFKATQLGYIGLNS
ncbi:MAG: helix-turn-helix transcriptional regulator [Sphingomonadales bacterium]|nr:helix-turn-helix transcriptional regulator [Sphingomonadales bacterium]